MKILIISCLLFLLPALSFADRKGNGGNPLGIDFAASAQDALADIQRLGISKFPEINVQSLASLISSSDVKIIVTSDPLFVEINGAQQPVTALSNAETKTITVNQALWEALAQGVSRKALALHEYLVLARIEKTGSYQISSRYSSLIAGRPYDLVPICKVYVEQESIYTIMIGTTYVREIYSYFGGSKKDLKDTICALTMLKAEGQCHGTYWRWGYHSPDNDFLSYDDLGLRDQNVQIPAGCL